MGVWTSLARKVVKKAARTIEKALLGAAAEADVPSEKAPADPFAKLKAAEAEKKKREREEK
jgi:hypothetical protein